MKPSSALHLALLGHEAHQNFFYIAFRGAKLFKSFCSFITSFVERFPVVEISPVARCFAKSIDSGINGFISGVVFLPEGFASSAVEGDSGDGCHLERRRRRTLRNNT